MNIGRKIHNLLHPKCGEIWMLHRVVKQRSENPEQRRLEVTPEWLETRIEDYRQRGYRMVGMDEIGQRGKWVCVTMDDGYEDNYTVALPLMKRLGVPFTVYVTTGFIDNRNEMWWYPSERLAMSKDEVVTLDHEPLCTIGAHTLSHRKLDTLTREEQRHELGDSKKDLEQLLGHAVEHLSFPHGAHNSDTLDICRGLGYLTMAKSWGGAMRRGVRYDVLPRIEIVQP